MKKTLMTCMAIAALFAIAGSASAITCTIDQRPAATLLVPYFEVSVNPDGSILGTGPNARDTLVTICNASAAPMIAHAVVWNERTELVLDFDIALTGFDCQSMFMSQIVTGRLPGTPITTSHATATTPGDGDACQRNASALVYTGTGSQAGRYLRIRPADGDTATPLDNALATTRYPVQTWPAGSDFFWDVLDSLDETDDTRECGDVDQVINGSPATQGSIRGYVTFDHVNYCNLSSPGFPEYYNKDAIGMENNLWGEVIFTSGSGIPTMGGSTVNIEADPSLAGSDDDETRKRTFYARWVGSDDDCFGTLPPNPLGPTGNCPKFASNTWNKGIGDQREPLGLKYAARWFDTAGVTSNFNVWRGSSDAGGASLADLLGNDCTDVLTTVTLTFFDEDENTVGGPPGCPSPPTGPGCVPTFRFDLETQRRPITAFAHPPWPAGWVNMGFNTGTNLDQAWVEYDIQGQAAFLSMSAPGTQLDPSTCNPLGVSNVEPVAPAIPTIVGTGS